MKTRLFSLIVLVSLLLATPSLGLAQASAPSAGVPTGLRMGAPLHRAAAQPWFAPERAGPGAVITVTTTDDELNADGDCSLREAIEAANSNAAADACGAGSGDDTVVVPESTYVLTLVGAMEDANQTGDLDILDNLVLTGAGAEETILDGNQTDRVLDVKPGRTVQINAVTVTHGYVVEEDGGGIWNQGYLTVNNVRISDNVVSSYWFGAGLAADAFVQDVSTTVNNSVITGNVGGVPGGLANAAGMDNGTATMVVNHSTISHNTATTWGGGIYNGQWLGFTNSVASMTVSDSLIENNDGGPGGGGGIYSGGYRAANQLGFLTVLRSTIRGNTTVGGMQGAIAGGGGIFASETDLSIDASTISGNLTSGDGSELSGRGGGLSLDSVAATISNSTISGNQAIGPGLPVRSGLGGGIEHTTLTFQPGDPSTSILNLVNTTVSGNSASVAGGGLDNGGTDGKIPEVTFKNTIIAGNDAPADSESCYNADWGAGPGVLTSLGNNLEDEDLCNLTQPSDLTDTDPLLAPLADNGGPTWTHALRTGSPAVNAGDDAAAPAADQRGIARPQGPASDIGAFEAQALHLNKAKMNSAPAGRPGVFKVLWLGRIHDQNHLAAPGVMVYGEYTYPNGSVHPSSGLTDSLGRVRFPVKAPVAGTYTFCVTDIAQDGYVYDPGANQTDPCMSIVVGP